VEIITVRLAPGFYGSSRMRAEAAASRSATMPLLAFNRKDTGWRIDWQVRASGRRFCQHHPRTLSLWRYRISITALEDDMQPAAGSRNRGHIAS
jgi:hypothetical protein